jgi:HAD superfamily hydrolase (TIGR01509 family)
MISRERFDAVFFDLDGVLTATAKVQAACWKRLFDGFLQDRAATRRSSFEPFDIDRDYRRYVDGKPRYEGVRSFLHSRTINLPEGTPNDPPGGGTVCALGNRKDEMVLAIIQAEGVETYPDATELLHHLAGLRMKTAVVSSSHTCRTVLEAAGLTDLFAVCMDGAMADERGLVGKPSPDTYLAAAAALSVTPARSIVVEDTIAGVEAGRAGAFGLVVGVDRTNDHARLRQHGADIVVSDLRELTR